MIQEKIEDYFSKTPDLKVLFFFDKDKEFERELRAINSSDYQIVFWENNPLTIKSKLIGEWSDRKTLLYFPFKHPSNQDEYHEFPLMGELLANKELQLDDVGVFMENFALQRHQKTLLSRYMSELKHKINQDICKPILNPENFNEQALQRGLLSAFLKFSKIENWSALIAKLLVYAFDDDQKEFNRVVSKVQQLGFGDVVIQKIENHVGFKPMSLTKDNLLQVGRSILYNRITQSISQVSKVDPYASLKVTDPTQIVRLNQMLQEVELRPQLSESFRQVLDKAASDIKGDKLIELYGETETLAEYTDDMLWAVISRIQDQVFISPQQVIKKLEPISLQRNVSKVITDMIQLINNSAKVQLTIASINRSYILNTPQEYIERYTSDWYEIDYFYRKAIYTFNHLDKAEIPNYIEIDGLQASLNSRYEEHTDALNREWLKCLSESGFDYASLPVQKQYDFYNIEVDPLDQKVVVVISDALRYEVGQELLSQMHADPNNTASMRYMLASIPSKTNIGMAQLLPHQSIDFNEGEVLIDEVSTSGIQNRFKILSNTNSSSSAIQFEDVNSKGQQEARDLFKNEVVYVYHDVIDSTGDKKVSERRTFEVTRDAINELARFVKRLHSSWNVAKVFVTADHGFLFNDKTIEDKDLEKIDHANAVQSHNRYYITKEQLDPDLGYSIPLSATTHFKDELFVTIPKSVNRYRKQGVGHQFVHGGGSLQELVVPLIESSRKREAVGGKVKPKLVNQGELKVVSNILRLNVLQETKLSSMEKERTIMIGLYKDLDLVSNEAQITLNSTSDVPSERMHRLELTLSSSAVQENFLKLKVFDLDDRLNPLIEELVKNNTLIETDF